MTIYKGRALREQSNYFEIGKAICGVPNRSIRNYDPVSDTDNLCAECHEPLDALALGRLCESCSQQDEVSDE